MDNGQSDPYMLLCFAGDTKRQHSKDILCLGFVINFVVVFHYLFYVQIKQIDIYVQCINKYINYNVLYHSKFQEHISSHMM